MKWLRYRADVRTVAYMLVAIAIPVVHWSLNGFSVWLLTASVVMAFAISAMHHNHAHVPIWTSSAPNVMTELWFAVFQGHPGFVFNPMHVENHHRYHNGPKDLTRTHRCFDSNNLFGLLFHPFEFIHGAVPHILSHARQIMRDDGWGFMLVVSQYILIVIVDGLLVWVDATRALYCVLVPQGAALFFLLISNYLQHAHADGESEFNHSRNFLGLINPLFFNVGYHTAHHHAATLHWSELPDMHRKLAPRIALHLNEPSFGWYCLRVFVLGVFFRRFRSNAMPPHLTPLSS